MKSQEKNYIFILKDGVLNFPDQLIKCIGDKNIGEKIFIEREYVDLLQKNADKIHIWKTKAISISQLRYSEAPLPKFNFLQKIRNISFSQLISLDLRENKIDTIESISVLRAPLLKTLILRKNNIVSFSPIRKIQSLNLDWISFSGNRIQQASYLGEGNWTNVKFIGIQVQCLEAQCQSISFATKIDHQIKEENKDNEMNYKIYIQAQDRISENLLQQSLKQKYMQWNGFRFETAKQILSSDYQSSSEEFLSDDDLSESEGVDEQQDEDLL